MPVLAGRADEGPWTNWDALLRSVPEAPIDASSADGCEHSRERILLLMEQSRSERSAFRIREEGIKRIFTRARSEAEDAGLTLLLASEPGARP